VKSGLGSGSFAPLNKNTRSSFSTLTFIIEIPLVVFSETVVSSRENTFR
jgi:hypothetical protein